MLNVDLDAELRIFPVAVMLQCILCIVGASVKWASLGFEDMKESFGLRSRFTVTPITYEVLRQMLVPGWDILDHVGFKSERLYNDRV